MVPIPHVGITSRPAPHGPGTTIVILISWTIIGRPSKRRRDRFGRIGVCDWCVGLVLLVVMSDGAGAERFPRRVAHHRHHRTHGRRSQVTCYNGTHPWGPWACTGDEGDRDKQKSILTWEP
jgi:hypothetical protein